MSLVPVLMDSDNFSAITRNHPQAVANILIAATALVHVYAVATNNERHFQRIPGLQLENWLK